MFAAAFALTLAFHPCCRVFAEDLAEESKESSESDIKQSEEGEVYLEQGDDSHPAMWGLLTAAAVCGILAVLSRKNPG